MKRILLVCGCFFLSLAAFALPDSSGLRMSLLTVGPGHDEIYEPFGHTGIRVIDTLNGTDLVYSYGSFNYTEPNFELKFMRGKLLYYMSVSSFRSFVEEYEYTHRKVEEQVLLLQGYEKQDIKAFLQYNLQPENKYYKYDFLFDNCATRVRDVFPKTFDAAFQFGETLPADVRITYRQIINQYLYVEHFARFGINILLGSRIDKVMSSEDAMFLPDFLRDGLKGATLSGKPVAGPVTVLLDGSHPVPAGVNGGLLVTLGVMLLTIAGLTVKRLRLLGQIMQALVLLVTGLLGCLIIVMWLGTDHQACQENLNVLWALPTSLLLAFRRRRVAKYVVIAILLLITSLVLHILRVQELPLFELWPWLVSLLMIYGAIYRSSKREETAS